MRPLLYFTTLSCGVSVIFLLTSMVTYTSLCLARLLWRNLGGALLLLAAPVMVLVCVGVLYTPWLYVKWKIDPIAGATQIRSWFSDQIEARKQAPWPVPTSLRSEFVATTLGKLFDRSNHPHPVAAGYRSLGEALIEGVCRATGLCPYLFQMSAFDERKGHAGVRTFHWGRDICTSSRNDPLQANSALVLIDVDYYLDMANQLLCSLTYGGRPTFLYTMVPSKVGTSRGENGSYTFTVNNEILYQVSGSTRFQHRLYDYSVDSLTVFRTILGIPIRASLYMVDRYPVSEDHQVILLTPMGTWNMWSAWMLTFLSSPRLKRLEVVERKGGEVFTHMSFQTSSERYECIGRPYDYHSAKIPSDVFSTVCSKARLASVKLSVATVEASGVPRLEAPIVTEYVRACLTEEKPLGPTPIVLRPEMSVAMYHRCPETFDPEIRRTLVPFMSPLYSPTLCPARTRANEEDGYKHRVKKPQLVPDMSQMDLRILNEFIDLLVPPEYRNSLDPVSLDEVWERQARRTQRLILEEAALNQRELDSDKPLAFIKAEAYSGLKPARLITTFPGVRKLWFSSYIYSLTSFLTREGPYGGRALPWYICGLTCRAIAERVTQVAQACTTNVANSDASKLDGSINAYFRHMEKVLLVTLFKQEHHSALIALHEKHFNQTVVTKHGYKYLQGFVRGTGSAATTAFNTCAMALTYYHHFRSVRLVDNFPTPTEAWGMMATKLAVSGDDGICGDVDPRLLARSALRLGIQLKMELVEKGKMGISFLSRTYGPEVWFGDASSMCDLKRQLSKFHTSVPLSSAQKPLDRLLAKAVAMFPSDAETPVLGEFVSSVIRSCRRIVAYDSWDMEGLFEALTHQKDFTGLERAYEVLKPYLVTRGLDTAYPNENTAGWMDHRADEELQGPDRALLRAWLAAVEQAVGDKREREITLGGKKLLIKGDLTAYLSPPCLNDTLGNISVDQPTVVDMGCGEATILNVTTGSVAKSTVPKGKGKAKKPKVSTNGRKPETLKPERPKRRPRSERPSKLKEVKSGAKKRPSKSRKTATRPST